MPGWQEQRHLNRCQQVLRDQWKAFAAGTLPLPWRAITTADVNVVIATWKRVILVGNTFRTKARNFRNICRAIDEAIGGGNFYRIQRAEFRAISELFFFSRRSFRLSIISSYGNFIFFFFSFTVSDSRFSSSSLFSSFFVSLTEERRSIRRFFSLYQREYRVFHVWRPTMDRVREFFSLHFLSTLERIAAGPVTTGNSSRNSPQFNISVLSTFVE